MRIGLFFFSFLILNCAAKAERPYRNYLLSKIHRHEQTLQLRYAVSSCEPGAEAGIPRYQIPKGNVFCRMEDKLTRTTRVWIKIGVQ